MTDDPHTIQPPAGSQIEDDAESPHLIGVQIDPAFADGVDADQLHRLVLYVLAEEGVASAVEVGVIVTTDAEIHALNRQYLGHDYPTDVISFTAAEEGEAPDAARILTEEGEGTHPAQETPTINTAFVGPPGWPQYLGDIVISYETAAAQAADYGHPPAAEVAVLLAHGLLHLLGYDDTSESERAEMHARQQALVDAFALTAE